MTIVSDEAIAEIQALQARRDAGEFDWEENGDYTNGDAYTIYKILTYIEECDSLHDNCDCLLDHEECYILINYIKQLEQKTKALIDPADLELHVKYRLEDCVKEFIKNNSFGDRK